MPSLAQTLLGNEDSELVIMIAVSTEEMHGSDRVPDLRRLQASLGWNGFFIECEMARFSERMR